MTHLRSVFAVLAAASSFLLLAGPAGGQATTSDPYGPTVPPTAPPLDPVCALDGTEVEAGTTVEGSLSGLEAGSEVEIVLGALGLGTVVADEDGDATFSFPLPDGAAGIVAAVGVTFTVECGEGVDLDLDGDVDVLGEVTERPPTGGGGGSGGGAGGPGEGSGGDGGADVLGVDAARPPSGTGGAGSTRAAASAGSGSSGGLARTGATLVPLVLLGLVAIAVGGFLRRRSRGRGLAV